MTCSKKPSRGKGPPYLLAGLGFFIIPASGSIPGRGDFFGFIVTYRLYDAYSLGILIFEAFNVLSNGLVDSNVVDRV
jgi:hypothetical protein